MNRNERIVAGAAVVILIAACSSGSGSTPASSQASSPASSQASIAAVTPGPTAVATRDITYGGTDALTKPEKLDVYKPSRSGTWPVVVMLHGAPQFMDSGSMAYPASSVAEQGFVVFVPSWGHGPAGAASAPVSAQIRASWSEAACAVAYARAHAADYGGDPAKLIVFGYSAGANPAEAIAFTPPTPTPGCLGGTSVGPIQALVTWDGDWTMTDSMWDEIVATDPAVLDLMLPFKHIASNKTLKVVMLMSDEVGPYVRDLSDPKDFETFFKYRDPTGWLQAQLDSLGFLDDKAYDLQEMQRLFYSQLKAQGNPVSLTVLPGANHDAMGSTAMPTFIAAFKEAAS